MKNKLSRRSFLSGSAAALASASLLGPIATSCQTATPVASIPGINEFGSKFGGVQIGAITYSWRLMPPGLENIVKYCKETGINSLELMSNDLEMFLGAPVNPRTTFSQSDIKPEEQAAIMEKYNADLKAFRLGVTPEKVASAKKLFDDAGIIIHTVKFSPSRYSSDEEIDYAFTTAKAMGAKAVCDELGENAVKRLAPFAEKHGIYAIFHNHAQFEDENFTVEPFLNLSPAVMLNFDAGHYYGSNGLNPCDFIRKYHDRIYSIHLKDRTGPKTEPEPDTNQVWGQGEVPLAEILLLIKNEGWPIYMDIEMVHDVKPWLNQVKEVKTCVQYARNILL